MDSQRFLDAVRASRHYQDQITHCHVIEARPPRFAETCTPLDDRLRSALKRCKIDRLYSHQAAAVDAAAPPEPRDTVIVTGTASGKTLCYNIPVINALLADPAARALYLFPTKALSQDQLGSLDRLVAAEPQLTQAIKASTYDGDTPVGKRRHARTHANIILSNPDMLHAAILPQHARWAREGFFPGLKYVVIDEVHSYRGTFGSHVAGVIRRLRRICRHYDSNPTFICCSATIANPRQLTARLISRNENDVDLIDEDGSPRGRKTVVMWNPPIVDRSGLERRSANIEAQRLMLDLIRDGAQTITFARARVVAELIYKYVHDELSRRDRDLAKRVRPYRGGYLANERREIEKLLFSGELRGVCSTNALELGIDVGSLDAVIVVGFPGTFCSFWQQAGRAGRTQDESLAVFIAYNDPIDQYFIRHPRYFFGQSPEHAALDPFNEKIFESQLKCAAAELPLSNMDDEWFDGDTKAFLKKINADIVSENRYGDTGDFDEQPASTGEDIGSPRASSAVDDRLRERIAHDRDHRTGQWSEYRDEIRYHERDGRLPHHQINLRLISNVVFDIIDCTNGRNESIGNVDSISAPELVYPNAIYLHDGRDYLVRKLDFDGKIAYIERVDVDYYTQAVLEDQCHVIDTQKEVSFRGGQKYLGTVDVTWRTVAFKKIKYHTLEVVGQDALDLPPQTIRTMGLWATFPDHAYTALKQAGHRPPEALVGVRNLLLVTLPMLAMCDRRDISGCVDSANLGRLAMFLYDRYHGGVGYTKLGFEHFHDLLTVCLELVRDCPCEGGCPSCVGLANVRPPIHTDPDVGPGYAIPSKDAARFALEHWLAEG